MITLLLSSRPDEHDLSDCIVLHRALSLYQYVNEKQEGKDPATVPYYQRIDAIVDEIRIDLTDELILPHHTSRSQSITLTLANELDDHHLSDLVVVNNALEEYRVSLKQAEGEELAYPAYYRRAHELVDSLRYDILDALLSRNAVARRLINDNRTDGGEGQANG